MPETTVRPCAQCGAIHGKADMLSIMVMDATHPLGMRAAWFCNKRCLAAWMDAQDLENS